MLTSRCCVACVGAIACTTAAIMRPQENKACIFGMLVDEKYLWLCFALALWGLGQGAGPVVEALLADSTRTGINATQVSLVACLAYVSGTFLCIVQHLV